MSDFPGQLDPLDPSGETDLLAQAAQHRPVVTHELDEAAFRAERGRRIKLSLLSSLLVRPLSFFIPIITIPLFLHYLGKERYGLYESVSVIAGWLGFTNAGLTLGLINRLTECDVKKDREAARRATATLTIAMIVMASAMILIYTAVVSLLPWHWLLPARDPRAAAETPWAAWVAGVITLLGLVSGIPWAIYTGYQETHRNNIWDGVAKVGVLLASVAVVLRPGFGTVGVIIAATGVPTVLRLVNAGDLFLREKRWLYPHLHLFHWSLLKSMLHEGLLLFLLQMSVVLLFQVDRLIISKSLGLEAVTDYALLGRLFLIGYGVYMMLLTPLWPAMGEAVRRGDLRWVQVILRKCDLLGCGMMAVMGLVILFGGPYLSHVIQRLGGGAQTKLSSSLIIAFTATFVVRAWVDSRSTILNASNVLRPQILFYMGHAVLNFIIAILVVRRFGVEGVAWTTAITALATSAWGYPWMMKRYIMRAPRTGVT